MEDWTNIYTFTKAVAEEVVRVDGENLPVCIVRPAIVISAYTEPSLGWVDVNNAYGPSGIILGLVTGFIHVIGARDEINFAIVPVDVVNNTIIVAARETYDRFIAGDKQTIIYAVTGSRNQFLWRNLRLVIDNEVRSVVSSKTIWYCFAIQTQYALVYWLLTLLLHFIPAVVMDGCSILVGQKPRFVKTYKLIYTISSVFMFYTHNEWIFHDGNSVELYNTLSQTDKLIFNCDMSSVNLIELVYIWAYGVGKYIVKDDFKNRKYAMRKQFVLRIVHYIILPLYLYVLFKIPMIFTVL